MRQTDRHGLNEDGEKRKQTSLEQRSGKNNAELSGLSATTGSSVISPVRFEKILTAFISSYQLNGHSQSGRNIYFRNFTFCFKSTLEHLQREGPVLKRGVNGRQGHEKIHKLIKTLLSKETSTQNETRGKETLCS